MRSWVGVFNGCRRFGCGAGGSNEQIENVAEIGIEHNPGLICDPFGGLVQIACIGRNKAITDVALSGNGHHYVTSDKVIEIMRRTDADMQTKYKEPSLGGLAANATVC